MATLLVVRPGLLTTIQDRGRWGWQARGVPAAGPMDPWSHRLANALVGNDAGAATLEVTLTGPEVEFEDERVVAIAGARFEVMLDGRPVPMDTPIVAATRSRLRFGARLRGARAYVALGGGIDVPPLLGSRATHLASAMGGLDGRPLRAGDRLPLGSPGQAAGRVQEARRQGPSGNDGGQVVTARRASEAVTRVRVLPGPHEDWFAGDALARLQSAPYTVGGNSDRMGYRLEGPALVHERGGDMISDATPLGSIQVPPSGQPVLLMADRQTTGGYPIVATVITADIGLAGQLGPGDALSFVVCPRREAIAALVARERELLALETGAAR
jgi:antagonist of KipI